MALYDPVGDRTGGPLTRDKYKYYRPDSSPTNLTPRQQTDRSIADSFDNSFAPGLTQATGSNPEDILQARILDQLLAARSRYNRLGSQTGATEADLAKALDPLSAQLQLLDTQKNPFDGFSKELTSSALGNTAGASVAAVNAARLAGDGRFGSGGNAAILASRGAVDAAVNQSNALSNALIQGKTLEANYQSNMIQQRGGVAAALSTLLQQQAGLKEERGQLGVAMEQEFANTLSGNQSVYGNVRVGMAQSKKTWRDKSPSIFGLI